MAVVRTTQPRLATPLAVLGLFLLIAAIAWNGWSGNIEHRLAAAYMAHRSHPFRWLGARHVAVQAVRNGIESLPVELYQSRAAILQGLAREPQDPAWTLALGESLILENQPDKAIETLKLAADLAADPVPAKIALACAYFERSSVAGRTIDLLAADQALGEVLLAAPNHPVALFNRALVQERLGNPPEAIALWNTLIAVERDSGWKAEALDHRNSLRVMLRDRERTPVDSESAFESYLLDAESAPPMDLAARLEQEHQDLWVADLQRLPSVNRDLAATLETLAERRDSMQMKQAPERMERLLEDAASAPPPLRVWAAFEYAYWQNHAFEQAAWSSGFESALQLAQERHYSWFAVQLLLERSSHRAVTTDQIGSLNDTREALSLAEKAHWSAARMRALNFLGSIYLRLGDYGTAAEVVVSTLQQYWKARFDYRRSYHALFDLMRIAEKLRDPHAAYPPMRTAAAINTRAGSHLLAAMAEERTGEWLVKAGDPAAARDPLARARVQIAEASNDNLRKTYSLLIDLSEAEVQGSPRLLEAHASDARDLAEPFMRLRFYRVLTSLAPQSGDARAALAKSLRFPADAAAAMSKADRIGWLHEQDLAWRTLIASELDQGRYQEAFEQWQSYLRTPASGPDPDGRHTAADRAAFRTRSGETILLSFFVQGNRIGCWKSIRGNLRFDWLPVSASDVLREARIFLRLCADPATRPEVRQAHASTLRIALLPSNISAKRILVQPDRELAALPWNALSEWSPLPFFSIALWPGRSDPAARVDTASLRALLAGGAVSPGGPGSAAIPLLDAGAELEAVAHHLRSTEILAGAGLTAERLEAALPSAQLFHFAGHSAVESDGVSLLLSPSPRNPDGRWHPAVDPELKHSRLAVFSACSTALYDEGITAKPANLAHAFLLKGVESVVASLWDVDSAATRDLMGRFYDRLAQTGEPWQALADPQRSGKPPFYWAAFQLYELL